MSESLRRAFVGVVPPPGVLDTIEALVPRERTGRDARRFRWTVRARWHVTVEFLGRIDDAAALTAELRDRVAQLPPFGLRLRGAGAFPEPKRAEVFWLGVDDPDGGLAAAHAAVVEVARDHGVRLQPVPFRPHLTLAYLDRRTDLRPEVAALDGVAVGEAWTVGALAWFDSDPSRRSTPDGPYHLVAPLPLGG
ncbi:MAG: RNA 2',3'-cyclic phosphodiesterase [Actinomycetes bacterium]